MPRGPRTRSESGLYHIVMRGINRQNIFEDEKDCEKFIETLEKYKDPCGYELYAYCLMGNHLHLLLKEGQEPLEQVMRRICGSYVYWYNRKYDRVVNLFQDRYKSEPVEDETYFMVVLRYIFQNPVKAGIVVSVEDYEWSNYKEYLIKNRMTDVDFVFDIFNKNRELAINSFIEFINKKNEDTCMDIREKKRITDKEASIIIKEHCKIDNAIDLQKLDIP
jgi:putative transposase